MSHQGCGHLQQGWESHRLLTVWPWAAWSLAEDFLGKNDHWYQPHQHSLIPVLGEVSALSFRGLRPAGQEGWSPDFLLSVCTHGSFKRRVTYQGSQHAMYPRHVSKTSQCALCKGNLKKEERKLPLFVSQQVVKCLFYLCVPMPPPSSLDTVAYESLAPVKHSREMGKASGLRGLEMVH